MNSSSRLKPSCSCISEVDGRSRRRDGPPPAMWPDQIVQGPARNELLVRKWNIFILGANHTIRCRLWYAYWRCWRDGDMLWIHSAQNQRCCSTLIIDSPTHHRSQDASAWDVRRGVRTHAAACVLGELSWPRTIPWGYSRTRASLQSNCEEGQLPGSQAAITSVGFGFGFATKSLAVDWTVIYMYI